MALHYHANEAAAKSLEEAICREGGFARAYPADLTQEAQVEALFGAVERDLGFVEGLVNSAGVAWKGASSTVTHIMSRMFQGLALALPFVCLVMVAQIQSLLSPFIVLFAIPLAFTGGMIGLLGIGEQLSMMSLMGFIVLMGTVVNNGILFVDYTNQLRLGGMDRRDALVATGKTRMRPILMTALTTILGMMMVLFSNDMASQLMSSMSIVIIGGLTSATFMTMSIVHMLSELFFMRMPPVVASGRQAALGDVP